MNMHQRHPLTLEPRTRPPRKEYRMTYSSRIHHLLSGPQLLVQFRTCPSFHRGLCTYLQSGTLLQRARYLDPKGSRYLSDRTYYQRREALQTRRMRTLLSKYTTKSLKELFARGFSPIELHSKEQGTRRRIRPRKLFDI